MNDDVHDVDVNDVHVEDDHVDDVDDVEVDYDDVDDDSDDNVDDVDDVDDKVDNVDDNVSDMMRRRRRSYENELCRWPVGKNPSQELSGKKECSKPPTSKTRAKLQQ